MKHNNSLFLSPRAAKKKKHPLTIAGKKTEKMQWIPPRLFFSFIASSRLPKALKKSKEWKSVTNESTFYDAQIELFFMLIWEKYVLSFRVYFYNFAGTKERNSQYQQSELSKNCDAKSWTTQWSSSFGHFIWPKDHFPSYFLY